MTIPTVSNPLNLPLSGLNPPDYYYYISGTDETTNTSISVHLRTNSIDELNRISRDHHIQSVRSYLDG